MSYQTLLYEVENHILTLTLHRPEAMNAFTVEMSKELIDAFQRADADNEVKAIIVTGHGRAFCAGMDLSLEGNVFGLDESITPESLDDYQKVADTGGTVVLAMYECRKPIIGAINGAAIGVGATMTLGMDIRLASEKARFGFVFSKLGIVNEACSSWFLPRLVGIPQTLEWLYKGQIFKAEEALNGKLIRSIHSPDTLLDEAKALAHSFVDGSSDVSMALIRQMIYKLHSAPHPLDAHKADSLGMFFTSLKDGKEGVNAFKEKRSPEYKSTLSDDMPPVDIV